MTKKIYRGRIEERDNGEGHDSLILTCGENHLILSDIVQEDIKCYGSYLSVRYFISNRSLELYELTESLLRKLTGIGDSEYEMCYSEITGYLYTHEGLKVGGHNLLVELRYNLGQYLHLEIEYREN